VPRALVNFLFGFTIGLVGLYAAGQVVSHFVLEPSDKVAQKRGLTLPNYEKWVEEKVRPGMLCFTFGGAVFCGALCAVRAPLRGRESAARRRSHPKADDRPLNAEEFESVLRCCLFVNLEERGPAYLQGLLVGRLVDTDADLAARIDRFSERHMTALWSDLRQKARLF
jgi:hypothetical protein